MKSIAKYDTVCFTTKGQVVIPVGLRRLFHIEDGTRAIVVATPEGILLKPVTEALIRQGRGIVRDRAGGTPMTQWWTEHRKAEKALENRHTR